MGLFRDNETKKIKCNITLHSLKEVNQLATLQAWPAT